MLGHIRRRAPVFAAGREALREAQRHEQEGGRPTDPKRRLVLILDKKVRG